VLELVRKHTQAASDAANAGASDGSATASAEEVAELVAAAGTAQTGFNVAAFNEELYRRAVVREAELLDRLRALKVEVQLLRSRQSLISSTPRKSHPHLRATSGSDSNLVAQGHAHAGEGKGPASPETSRRHVHMSGMLEFAEDHDHMQDVTLTEEEDEREQRLIYLRQAFCGFFRAKQGVEMQNLARVMCAILGVEPSEQTIIMESIDRLVPALVATTTLESLSYNFSSLFS